MARVPIALTVVRALLAPVILLLAVQRAPGAAFGFCLAVAFISDVFDGIIARRLNVATAMLRRLDSVADSVFYVAALVAALRLHAALILEHICALAVLLALECVRYVVDWRRFRREAAYHMWSSKLWGAALFVGFSTVLVFNVGGWPVAAAIYLGILADMEGLAISFVLRDWKSDVPTLVHAVRLRHATG